MFRRLLALEVSAIRNQLEELRRGVEDEGAAIGAATRELFASTREIAQPGIWTLRRPL